MRTTIDKAGRVVIPVSARARAGFAPGSELEVVVDDGGIRLLRVAPAPRLERVGKRLVARPQVEARTLPKVDLARLVEDERDRWPW